MTLKNIVIETDKVYKCLINELKHISELLDKLDMSTEEKIEIDQFYTDFPEYCQNELMVYAMCQFPRILYSAPAGQYNHIIDSGPNKDKSAIYGLFKQPHALKVLSQMPNIVAQFAPSTINHITEAGGAEGLSPVFWLCYHAEGHQLMRQFPDLAQKIQGQSFNLPASCEEHQDMSPCALLFSSLSGIDMLDNSGLLAIMNHNGLNHRRTVRIHEYDVGVTEYAFAPIHSLTLKWNRFHKQTMTLFHDHLELFLPHIQSSDLCEIEPSMWQSLLHTLFENECFVCRLAHMAQSGRQDIVSQFLDQITPEALNRNITDSANQETSGVFSHNPSSPLSWLCSTESGCELIQQFPQIKSKITESGFNHIQETGRATDGMTAAYLLVAKPYGREIFGLYPGLVDFINEDSLNSAPEENINETDSENGVRGGERMKDWILYGCDLDRNTSDTELRGRIILKQRIINSCRIDPETARIEPTDHDESHHSYPHIFSERYPKTPVIIETEEHKDSLSEVTGL